MLVSMKIFFSLILCLYLFFSASGNTSVEKHKESNKEMVSPITKLGSSFEDLIKESL